MDILDHAQALEEGERSMALAAARRGISGPLSRGMCLFCAEEFLPADHRWCDAWCRDQWQRQTDVAAKWPRVLDD